MRTDLHKKYHYTYYSYEEFGRGYIGVRSCNCKPEEDVKYFGSFYDKSFRPTRKIILETYETREEANKDERILHRFYDVRLNPNFANKHNANERFCNTEYLKNSTPEQRSERARKAAASMTPEQRSERARKREASMTPEQRSEAERKRQASTTPEQRSERSRKAAASMTAEQRSERSRKAVASMTPEQRSERGRKAQASLTPEQRSEVARKREASLTPEQRSERSRKAAASMTAEQRSEVARKREASMTPEQRSERGRKRAACMTPEQREKARESLTIALSQRWQCTVTGFTTNAGSLSRYQKARGIDTSNRVRLPQDPLDNRGDYAV